MIVKTIVNKKIGTKLEIIKHENITGFAYPVYTVKYYEFFKACGWRELRYGEPEYCTKEFIEECFDIKIA